MSCFNTDLSSGNAARLAMPNLSSPVTTTVTEAMHFQRGLHYLIVKVRRSVEIAQACYFCVTFVCLQCLFSSSLTQEMHALKNVKRKMFTVFMR